VRSAVGGAACKVRRVTAKLEVRAGGVPLDVYETDEMILLSGNANPVRAKAITRHLEVERGAGGGANSLTSLSAARATAAANPEHLRW
jgi:hypothetical protein